MKNKRMLSLIVAASMVAGGLFTSCGDKTVNNNGKNNNTASTDGKGNSDKKDGENNKEEKLDKEQHLTTILGSDPKTLDSSRASDVTSSDIMSQIMEGLTRVVSENGKDVVVPGLAESWETSDDGLTWTFHLRDAKWSDGKAVTAQDFEFGIKRAIDPAVGSSYAFILYPIKNAKEANDGTVTLDEFGVKAIDDKTLQFTLENPCPYFLQLSFFKVMLPLRKDITDKYGETYGSEGEHILSTGAFTLEEWAHNDKFVFKKNPNYWAADEVKLDTLTFKIVKERTAAYNALSSGMIDLCGVTDPAWMKNFKETGEFDYIKQMKPCTFYSYFNQENRYFKNAKIRKAFLIAVDREELNEIAYDGSNIPAYAEIPPTLMLGEDEFRTAVNSDPVQKLIDENPDPKALLIEGLKELGEDPDPSKMKFKILSMGNHEKGKERMDYKIEKYKSVLGVSPEADIYEWAIYQEKVDNQDYDLATDSGWQGDYNDPNTFMEIYKSGSKITPTGFSNKEYDELVDKAAREQDPKKRLEMYKRAEEILLYEEAVLIPEVYDQTSTFQRKYVKNVNRPLFGGIDFTRAYTVGR